MKKKEFQVIRETQIWRLLCVLWVDAIASWCKLNLHVRLVERQQSNMNGNMKTAPKFTCTFQERHYIVEIKCTYRFLNKTAIFHKTTAAIVVNLMQANTTKAQNNDRILIKQLMIFSEWFLLKIFLWIFFLVIVYCFLIIVFTVTLFCHFSLPFFSNFVKCTLRLYILNQIGIKRSNQKNMS